MRIRELAGIAFALVGLNILSLPTSLKAIAEQRAFVKVPIAKQCGCTGGSSEMNAGLRSGSQLSKSNSTADEEGGFEEPQPLDPPSCAAMGYECTWESWSWWHCQLVNLEPLTCYLWQKHFWRIYCEGVNYHCCYTSWEHIEDDTCENHPPMHCTSETSTTLPSSCSPPIPPPSTECTGCIQA